MDTNQGQFDSMEQAEFSNGRILNSYMEFMNEYLGMTKQDIAVLIHSDVQTIDDIVKGKAPVVGRTRSDMRKLTSIMSLLLSAYTPASMAVWFKTPTAATGNKAPLDIIKSNDDDRLAIILQAAHDRISL